MERGGPGATAGALPLSRLPRLLPKPMETSDVPKSPPPPNAEESSRSTAPIVDVGLRELVAGRFVVVHLLGDQHAVA